MRRIVARVGFLHRYLESTRRPCDGLTLIEILVALFILSVGAAGIFAISSLSTTGNTRSKDVATATALAIELLEDAKNRGYEALPASTDAFSDGALTADGAPGGIYTRVWQVSGEHLVAGVPARTITVAVSWPGGDPIALSTRIVRSPETTQGFPIAFVSGWNQTQ